jgi:diadenosine tetraphosphate (Ap4A) HIT family hydrolase
MNTKECPFCSILADDKNNQIICRGKNFTAIRKLYHSNNVNFLIISNTHVKNLKTTSENFGSIDMNELIAFIVQLSKLGTPREKDWSITSNNGENAGQTEFHFHVHISSCEDMSTWGIHKQKTQSNNVRSKSEYL